MSWLRQPLHMNVVAVTTMTNPNPPAPAPARGDGRLGQAGFWRFVALMELARVAEAESALVAFHRAATAAGDMKGVVMATARHAMLANLRGRFGEATELIAEVAAEGPRAGLSDTYRVIGSVWAEIAFYRGPQPARGRCWMPSPATPI